MIDRGEAPEASGTASNKVHRPSAGPADHLRGTEDALYQCREMLRFAMSAGKLGSWERNIRTGEMTCSPDYLRNLGLEPSATLTFDQLQRMRHPDDVEHVNRAVETAIATGTDYDVAYRVIRPDGTIGRVIAKGRPVYENGEAVRMFGVTMNVTDQEDAQQAIRQAQRQQEFLLALNDSLRDLEDPFAIMDVAARTLGQYLLADRVGYGELDEKSGRLSGREWRRETGATVRVSYELHDFGTTLVDPLKRGQSIVVDDTTIDSRIDSGARAFYTTLQARALILIPLIKAERLDALLYVALGEIVDSFRKAILTEDVAERTWSAVERAQAEINLRESEARLRIIAETLPALVWIISPDLRLVYANARWSRYSGLPENEALGFSWMKIVHPEDVERIIAAVENGVRERQEAYSVEARYRNLDGVYRWHLVRAEPLHDAKGGFRGWSGTSVDIHDLKETEEALRRNEAQLRIALQAAHMGVWSWDTDTDVLTFSDRAAGIFGFDAGGIFTWTDLLKRMSPEDTARAVAAMEKSLSSGEQYNVEYRLARSGTGPRAWVAAQGQVTYGRDGKANGLTGVVQDITERKEAQERQQLLIRELHHRVKNTLATVQAIVGSTARTASSIDEFYQGFVGRIVSLARTHNLLTEDLWQKASLGELVRTELGPYDDEHRNRIVIEGPDVELPSEAAVPIGMAIHELTTNAAKHGALSTFGGQVDVHWRLERSGAKPVLHFSWTERGGPLVTIPTRQGFGSRLLQRVLTTQLQADVHMDFDREGLRFTMVMPMPGEPPLLNSER